ncbi:spermatogenesis-associated protein 21 [Erethizon dorsatum]
MDNRNTLMDMEDRTEHPGVQPHPVLSPTRKRADAESTTSALSQVDFPDAAEIGNGKQLLSTLGGPERGPLHTETSKEGCSELGTQEQGPPERPRKNLEGTRELGAGQDQAHLGSKLRVLPSRPHETPEELQQPGTEAEDQQGKPYKPGTGEDQPLESHQDAECRSPGQQAENGLGTVHLTESCYTLDSRAQPLEDNPCGEAGDPRVSPWEALREPASGGRAGSSQGAMCPTPMATAEENTATSLLPSTLGPKAPQEGVFSITAPNPALGLTVAWNFGSLVPCEGHGRDNGSEAGLVATTGDPRHHNAVEAPERPSVFDARDIDERRELGHAQESESPGYPQPGFMKCLLEAEEEEAAHQRAWKARAATARKSPRTLMRGPISVPISHSAPLTLPQPPTLAPATSPLWARSPVPTPVAALVPASVPGPILRAPVQDLGWRWTELLPQNHEWSPSCTRPWQELEDHSLLRLWQGWEEQAEEPLTLKQEEAFRSYFEIFNGPGEVDSQSLKNILGLVGFSLTPAQVEAALMSADVDGDGHVDFKDFLAVMTDTRRFFCSMEQNAVTNVAASNPHTLLFEILSLLVEMLALPETVLEEITNYYQKKLKEGTYKAREMASATAQLRSQKQVSYNHQQADHWEVPERRVLSILSWLKQNAYHPPLASDLHSPYARVPCIPLCPRLNKKRAHRKQGSYDMLDQCAPASLSTSARSLFSQSGPQGSRHAGMARAWQDCGERAKHLPSFRPTLPQGTQL